VAGVAYYLAKCCHRRDDGTGIASPGNENDAVLIIDVCNGGKQ